MYILTLTHFGESRVIANASNIKNLHDQLVRVWDKAIIIKDNDIYFNLENAPTYKALTSMFKDRKEYSILYSPSYTLSTNDESTRVLNITYVSNGENFLASNNII